MTEQEIHNSLKLLKSQRKEILELKEQIAEAATYINSSSWSSPKVTGGTFITPQERYLERTERLNKQFDKALDEYGELANIILDIMKPLPPIRGMSMKRTAEVMEFTVNWVKDIQADAIKQMSEFSEAPPPK